MNVVCYAPEGHSLEDALFEAVASVVPPPRLRRCASMGALDEFLFSIGRGDWVFVLAARDQEGLEELLRRRRLLRRYRLILVLPDSSDKTAALGHALFPRFVAYEDEPLAHVAQVLRKLVHAVPSVTADNNELV